MIKIVYAVFDNAARIYSTPFYAPSAVIALRDFSRATNDGDSPLYHNPNDFDLMELGNFDDETGMFSIHEPVFVQNAAFLRKFDGV